MPPPPPPPPPIIVGCIHLLFNPRRGDHKLGQLRVFVDRVEAQRAAASRRRTTAREAATSASSEASGEQLATARWPEPQVIMTGDFNAQPDSPLYYFLAAVGGFNKGFGFGFGV
jgi:endonuclease/exonuclease/phosphatase family metal-dependent hydrolase